MTPPVFVVQRHGCFLRPDGDWSAYLPEAQAFRTEAAAAFTAAYLGRGADVVNATGWATAPRHARS